jgi:AcrR family transcriptional regulator
MQALEKPKESLSAGTAEEVQRDSAKLRQILEGARRVFLADGFDGTSMNDVARLAGVSKGTLYVYFASKEALFEALIRDEKRQQAERICNYDATGDVGAVLRSIGRNLMWSMTRPEAVAQVRTVIAVAPKFPNIGRAFDEAGPQYGAKRLIVYLEGEIAAGNLVIADPAVAARHFVLLCQGDMFRELLFGVRKEATESEIESTVAAAVEVFLKAYGRSPEPAG